MMSGRPTDEHVGDFQRLFPVSGWLPAAARRCHTPRWLAYSGSSACSASMKWRFRWPPGHWRSHAGRPSLPGTRARRSASRKAPASRYPARSHPSESPRPAACPRPQAHDRTLAELLDAQRGTSASRDRQVAQDPGRASEVAGHEVSCRHRAPGRQPTAGTVGRPSDIQTPANTCGRPVEEPLGRTLVRLSAVSCGDSRRDLSAVFRGNSGARTAATRFPVSLTGVEGPPARAPTQLGDHPDCRPVPHVSRAGTSRHSIPELGQAHVTKSRAPGPPPPDMGPCWSRRAGWSRGRHRSSRPADLDVTCAQAWFRRASRRHARPGGRLVIAAGEHTLVIAPTGSGRLWRRSSRRSIDWPPRPHPIRPTARVLYISPLKALAVDVQRNLRAPLAGLRQGRPGLVTPEPDIRIGVRTGDTRQQSVAASSADPGHPHHHARVPVPLADLQRTRVAAIHRHGDHRRDPRRRRDQTWRTSLCPWEAGGTSRPSGAANRPLATVRPPEEVARFLTGGRPARVVEAPVDKDLLIDVVVPVEDMTMPEAEAVGAPSVSVPRRRGRPRNAAAGGPHNSRSGPTSRPRCSTWIEEHTSTLVFANSRRLAERLTGRLNELASERTGTRTWWREPTTARSAARSNAA